MNNLDLQYIATTLGLGDLRQDPMQLDSGLFSQVWRIDTDKPYIIKFLESNSLRSDADYELGEQLALTFKNQGIPAVPALIFNGKQLQQMGAYRFFIYPYVFSKTRPSMIASAEQAACIGHYLGRMHQCMKTQSSAEGLIPSHRDLHPKNVIWDESNHPHIIDWEWAGFIEPDFDAFHAALMWAGLLDAQFHKDIYVAFLSGYHAAGQAITQEMPVLLKTLSDFWTDWLLLLRKQVDQTEKNPEVQRAIAVLTFITHQQIF